MVSGLSSMMRGVALLVASGAAVAQATAPLTVESKISLGDIRGRIDHLAVDVSRQRLYVAELGNDTVGVVDLRERKLVRTLAGLKEPQRIGYVSSTDTVYVANSSDGSVRLFQGPDLRAAERIALGDDADNVRVKDAAQQVVVGYGDGALAILDAVTHTKVADIPLKAHPESFRIEATGEHIYVNVPRAHEIAVVDQATRRQIDAWPTGELSANFPLALDESHQKVLAVFRHPAMLAVFRAQDGRRVATVQTCGDSDDLFVDTKRSRIYVICGEGYVDVLGPRGESYASVGRIATLSGARTGLFIPEIDRLIVATRARGSESAAIWVLRPLS
jgi:DNA-binding beta-propeller fold protein YncE